MKYVRNKNDLRQFIHEEMQQRGPACNLNHLDISRLNDVSFLFQTFPTFCGDISGWTPPTFARWSVYLIHAISMGTYQNGILPRSAP